MFTYSVQLPESVTNMEQFADPIELLAIHVTFVSPTGNL